MRISLFDEMKAFVESPMTQEGFASASESVRSLVRDAQRRKAGQDLAAKLLEGLQSGPAMPMTREDWGRLRRTALEGLAGESIGP